MAGTILLALLVLAGGSYIERRPLYSELAPLRVLASGQSNMAGYAVGGDFTFSPLVRVWNNTAQRIDLFKPGSEWVYPSDATLPDAPFNGRNSLPAHAADMLARALDRQIDLVIVARGGEPIGSWLPGAAPSMMDRIALVAEKAGIETFDLLLWHHGESAVEEGTVQRYSSDFKAVIAEMERRKLITSSTPIVIGEIKERYDEMNAVLHGIAEADPRISIVSLKGLIFSGFHLIGDAVPVAGQLYGSVALDAIKPPKEPVVTGYDWSVSWTRSMLWRRMRATVRHTLNLFLPDDEPASIQRPI